MKEQLSSNIEDYLETIVMLKHKSKVVRVKDIAKKMRVTMPSVHSALCTLKNQKLVNHEKYGYVELTEKGEILGNKIYDIHKRLTDFFVNVLNIDPVTAETDACKLEHGISCQTLERLTTFIEFLKYYQTRKKDNLIKKFFKFQKEKNEDRFNTVKRKRKRYNS